MNTPTIDRQAQVVGHFDGVFGRVAAGWAFCPARPGSPVPVQVLAGDKVVAECLADSFREDLEEQGIGNGCHSFKCVLPIELFDGEQRWIEVRAKGGAVMAGGPHLLNRKLATLQDAFTATSAAAARPLSDFQVAMLHGLTRACEALAEQSLALRQLNATLGAGATIDRQPETQGESGMHGPLLKAFRDSPRHKWDVVVFAIIDWDFRVQRPQHLTAQLARMGSRVAYVSVHLSEQDAARPRFEVRRQLLANVFEVSLACPPPVPSVYAGIHDPAHLAHLSLAVEDMLDGLGIKEPLALIHYPTWFPVAASMPGACLIYDCMDHIGGFSTASPEVVEVERELASSADLTVTTSQFLHDALAPVRYAPIVRNGAEVDFFSVPPTERVAFGKGPVIGYFGAIAEWFDVDLLVSLARARPDWTFALVGATAGADVTPLAALANVKLFGEVPYTKLPDYLYAFDCCLIPFKLIELTKATNPVKLYEYFSAGKPVVASDMPELRLVPAGLLHIAHTAEDFISGIAASLDEAADLAERRKLWAMRNSWVSRGRELAGHIEKAFPRVSIVVLCYNELELTRACLYSIDRHSHYPNLEIIIIDNNSQDGTRKYLEEWVNGRADAKVFISNKNLGFAGGNNVGITRASGDYIVILNNDTFVTDGWVRDLIRPLTLDPRIGLAGPVTNMIGNEQKLNIHYADMTEMAHRSREFTRGRKRKIYKVESLAFFCVAIPRRIVEEVGLLDTSYGLGFFEDDDYCMRVKRAGYDLAVADGVFVHHHLSGSFDRDPEQKKSLMARNRQLFESRWGPWQPHKYRDEPCFGG